MTATLPDNLKPHSTEVQLHYAALLRDTVKEDLRDNRQDFNFSALERRIVARLLGERVCGRPGYAATPAHPVKRKRVLLRNVMTERSEVAAFVACWPLLDETENY